MLIASIDSIRELSAQNFNCINMELACCEMERSLAVCVDRDTQIVVCAAVDVVNNLGELIVALRDKKFLPDVSFQICQKQLAEYSLRALSDQPAPLGEEKCCSCRGSLGYGGDEDMILAIVLPGVCRSTELLVEDEGSCWC